MVTITHKNAVQELLKRVPELKAYRQFDADELNSPTIVFDSFGDFLLERIVSESYNEALVKRCFDLINEMQESDDLNVQNLPQVGVFEVLAGSKKGLEVAEGLLNETGREWLNKIKQHFRAT